MNRIAGLATAVVFAVGVGAFASLNSLRLGWREKEVWLVAVIAAATGMLVAKAYVPGRAGRGRSVSTFVWLVALTPPLWAGVLLATRSVAPGLLPLPWGVRVILASAGCLASLRYLAASSGRAGAVSAA